MDIPYIYLLVFIAWLVIGIGLFLKDYPITMLGAIFVGVMGVWITINGLTDITNLATESFGVLHIGIAGYILIKSSVEVFSK